MKEPSVFDQTIKNFSHWKKTMINYMNILDIWDIVVNGYVPQLDETTKVLTKESKLAKRDNDNTVSVILNSVSESVSVLYGNMTTTNEMWNALLTRYEENIQIKRTKLTSLEIKFENFRIEDGEILEDIY
jgi:gag-polypeptide of LTR copia-type